MVVLNSGTAITNSSIVGSQHFGLNFLIHHDGGSEGSIVFEEIVNDLHRTGSIRFPGGTVAEIGVQRIDDNGNTFFVESPLDISISDGNLANSTLSFLEDAAQNGWNVTIVLPMWRFLNVATMSIDENAVNEISEYVAAVISEASRLGVTIDGFELGNEWDILSYSTSENLTRAEAAEFSLAYANFAAELAVAVQADISLAEDPSGVRVYSAETEPFIAIQTLWAWRENSSGYAEDFEAAIRTAFPDGSGAQDAVDAILAHFYLWQPGGGGQVEDPSTAYFLRNMEDINAIFGGELDYLISEWNLQMNVNGGAQPNVNSADGIQQLEPIVGLFHTLISEGVDHANFWAVRESAWNSLYGLEIENGMPQYVRPVRYILDLLSDQLVGTVAIDMNGAASGNMGTIEDDIHVYGFEDNNGTVLYFGSVSESIQSIDLDLQNFTLSPENTLIQITRISVDDPTLRSYLQTTTVVTEEYTFAQFQALEGDFLVFSPYELISIEIIIDVGLGEIETGTNIQDLMFGTAADDIFFGSIGADDIYGYFGNDTVDYLESDAGVNVFLNSYHGTNSGGDADGDRLHSLENVSGSSHDDTISGDGNANVLNGRAGSDVLFGRFGNDILDGGIGDDILDGGAGDDFLVGGAGDDQFVFGINSGNDSIADFDIFRDTLDYHSLMESQSGLKITINGEVLMVGQPNIITDNTEYEMEVSYNGRNSIVSISEPGGQIIATLELLNIDVTLDPIAFLSQIYLGNNVSIPSIGTSELVYSGGFHNIFQGTAGGDMEQGGGVVDYFFGNGGDDYIRGGAGGDFLYGGEGHDTLNGESGIDHIYGGDGDDVLNGGRGNDILTGGDGDDVLIGGAGDDLMEGGNGHDTFVFNASQRNMSDVISDFDSNEDTIFISGVTFEELSIQEYQGGITVSWDDNTIRLVDVSILELNEESFTFV